VNLLLDTHALIWALSAPKRLPGSVARAVADPDNSVHISAFSTWEIAIKSALGKIKADLDEIAAGARETGFVELPVRIRDTIRLRSLPAHHRDPFDRMLIAQALEHGFTLVTRDPAFRPYPIATLWS